MYLPYKGHAIGTIPWQMSNSNRWQAKVIVQWAEGDTLRTQHFASPTDGFGSEERADLWAIALGRKWIDAGKPSSELVDRDDSLLV